MELADIGDLKSPVRNGVWVQVPPGAPYKKIRRVNMAVLKYKNPQTGLWTELPMGGGNTSQRIYLR